MALTVLALVSLPAIACSTPPALGGRSASPGTATATPVQQLKSCEGRSFEYTATAANISDYYTVIHDSGIGEPDALLQVSHDWGGQPNSLSATPGPPSSTNVYDDHPLGVFYTSQGQWAIFNEDKAPMPVGATFNVRWALPAYDAPDDWGRYASQHIATVLNSGAYTVIDDPHANGQPGALVYVTQNLTPALPSLPPRRLAVYNPHPLGVFYTAQGQWAIFNEDNAPIPAGAAFNLLIKPAPDGASFLQVATASNTVGNETTILDKPGSSPDQAWVFTPTLRRGKPSLLPGGRGFRATDNPHNTGLYFNALLGKWAIFNEDITPMPVGAAFNVAAAGVC
jgi:hypothetical protein